MSPTAQLQAFAQSIYLAKKGRYFDDISGTDGQEYVNQVIDWTNMFVDELEDTLDPSGEIVDWWFARENGYELGTATQGEAIIDLPSEINRLITDELRYVQITQDGTVVSNWAVVQPGDITNNTNRITEDMCAVVGESLVFSRVFRDTEEAGTIIGDVSLSLPRLTSTNVKLLTLVKPKLLLKLGVVKNSILPDIVQGGLTPSFSQKYDTLLAGAITRSMATSTARKATRDNYSGIGGV